MMQRKLALQGINPTQVIEFTPLDEDEIYNSSDDEEASREIEEEWHTDDELGAIWYIPCLRSQRNRGVGNTEGMNELIILRKTNFKELYHLGVLFLNRVF